MGRNGAACTADNNFFKGCRGLNKLVYVLYNLIITACMGYENSAEVYIRLIRKTVFYILFKGLHIFPAILLANTHTAVLYPNTRLEL